MNDYILGCIESPIDERDYILDDICCISSVPLPNNFMLDYKFDILDQGQAGSCVAHALSECKSFIDDVDKDNMYSVGFIYANREENQSQGTGMITREALSNLVKYGDCFKNEFPINEEYPSIVNTLSRYGKEKLIKSASNHKSTAYATLNIEQIKEYLYIQQKPVLISVRVYDNFYESNYNKGIIPSIPTGTYRGNHLVLCIGYRNNDDLIIVNSWNKYNGDNGKYYLNYNSKIIKELWVLEDKKVIKATPLQEEYLYRLQLGAFSKRENAYKLAKELNNKGIATCIKQINGLYKIQVGCFKVKDNCDNYKKEIKLKGYDCFIVTEKIS